MLHTGTSTFSQGDLFYQAEEEKSVTSSESETEAEEEELEEQADKEPPPQSEVVILIRNRKTGTEEVFRVLLDSGTTKCMATSEAVSRAGLHVHTSKRQHRFNTAAGIFTTTHYARIKAHKLLELNSRRVLLNQRVQIHNGNLGPYDFIFGRDYMTKYGIDLIVSEKVIHWDGMQKPMREQGTYENLTELKERLLESLPEESRWQEPINYQRKQISVKEELFEARQILESKYDKQDLKQVADQQTHLTKQQRDQLFEQIFKGHEQLFAGKLGEWPYEKVGVQLKPGHKPYHCQRPIRIPHVHLETLKKEVQRLVDIGVLEVVDGGKAGPWCAPSFIIPKKDGRVRFITDFRELNKAIQRRPWPMPHITDLLQDIGQYKFVTALDLSMGYYHMVLDEELSDMTTFMLPWGLYKYKRLPMGLNISPDIFQEKVSKLLAGSKGVKVYMDDILIFSNGTYENHLEQLKHVLDRLAQNDMAVNALKSYWAVDEVDYLGFRLTQQGVLPQPRKVKAILNMEKPKTKKQLRGFIGMINYYRYMWKQRSQLLAPLSEMAGKNKPFKWTDKHDKAFREIKRIVSKRVLLSFPDYSKPFQLYTDASDLQLGSVLMQEGKSLAFFSKKLTETQKRYGTGEKEMLSVVESLKEFRTMIKGYPIQVFVDHKNWTHDTKSYKNDRVMRWRLLMEEYDLTFHYIQGEKNVVADTLSRLPYSIHNSSTTQEENANLMEEVFEVQEAEWRRFYQPLTIAEIGRKQKADKYIKLLTQQAPDRLGEVFEDIGKKTGSDRVLTELDIRDKKQRIVVPQELTHRLISWYHTMLVHPGSDRLYNTLRQHYTWRGMEKQVKLFTKHCHACQLAKRGFRGRGHIPIKDVETEPWKDIAVDCAGPWEATVNNQKVSFWTLTIIDVFTGWVEIIPIKTKKMEVIRDLVVQEWLRRYPRPSRCIFDAGGEFDNQEFRNLCTQWYFKPEPITVKNPRANAIVERMHRVLGDMIRVQLTTKHEQEDVIKELTSAAAYGLRATVHGVTKFTPGQLVFQKDMILRTNMVADVELIRQRRQQAIAVSNARENKRRIAHKYKPGDKVLIISGGMDPKLKLHAGPYQVINYNKSNGTLHIKRKNYIEPINIRQVRPYFGPIGGGD